MSSASLPERVASLAFSTFDTLPTKCKPRILPNVNREWTPMAAVILAWKIAQGSTKECPDGGSKDGCVNDEHEADSLNCVSLATGTKCLPHTALPLCKGTVLHDSHAEVLALRGLNRFLLDEISNTLSDASYESPFIVRSSNSGGKRDVDLEDLRLFRMKEGLSIYLFTTSAPCGDASMDLLIESRPEDNVPWTQPASHRSAPVSNSTPTSPTVDSQTTLHGHADFSPHLLSRVRLKPSRADAPPTHSKSCSDKLALRQFTGLLGFPLDLLLTQTFLTDVVVPADSWHERGWERAFGKAGRLSRVIEGEGERSSREDTAVSGRACVRPVFFNVLVLPTEFPPFAFSRSLSCSTSGDEVAGSKTSNISALFICGSSDRSTGTTESLLNGVKQGFKQSSLSRLKESAVCRRRMWEAGIEILGLLLREKEGLKLGNSDTGMLQSLQTALGSKTCAQAKGCAARRRKREIKALVTRGLGGWIHNTGDEGWELDEASGLESPAIV